MDGRRRGQRHAAPAGGCRTGPAHGIGHRRPARRSRRGPRDLMEAVGDHRAALDIRVADSGGSPQAQRLSRIACCQLALGAHHEAVATFASAIRHYAGASPLPLGRHAVQLGTHLEHVGDRGRAELAYRAVMRNCSAASRARQQRPRRASSDHGAVGRKSVTEEVMGESGRRHRDHFGRQRPSPALCGWIRGRRCSTRCASTCT